MGVTPARDRAQVADFSAPISPFGHSGLTGVHRDQHHHKIHDARDHKTPAKGALVLQFDDCWYQQKPILDYMAAHDQRATLMVNHVDLTSTFGYSIGNPTCLSIADLLVAQRQGHEIGNHTYNHIDMSAASAATRATQLDSVTSELVAAGLPAPRVFAYPYGYRNYFTDRDLATRFDCFRYAGTMQFRIGYEVLRIGATRILTDSATPSGLGDMRISDAKAMVRQLVSRPMILCFFNHLGPTYVGTEATIQEYIGLLDYARSLGIPCVTMSEAFIGPNMAPNPSLEDNGGSFDGWSFFLHGGSGTSSVVSTTPYTGGEGSFAGRLVTTSPTDHVYRGFRASVEEGRQYVLAARYKLTGGPSAATTYAADTWTRVTVAGWGTADTGGAWTTHGTAADFNTGGSTATIAGSAGGSDYATLGISQGDVNASFSFQYDKAPTGANHNVRFYFRWVDASNHMYFQFSVGVFGFGAMQLFKVVAGVVTQVGATFTNGSNATATFRVVPSNAANTKFWARVVAQGTTVRASWWLDTDEAEPDYRMVVITDSTMPTAAGGVGLGVQDGAGLSNGPITTTYDNLTVQTPNGVSGAGFTIKVFQIDPNGNTLSPNVNVVSNVKDLQQSTWAQIGFDGAITAVQGATAFEVRFDLTGLTGTADFDHTFFSLARTQPDGPLG